MFKTEPGSEQAEFIGLTCISQVFEAFPDFRGLDVEVFDGLEQIPEQADDDLLNALIDRAFSGIDIHLFYERINLLTVHTITP